MKRISALMGLILAVCALACAQESTGDRVVVPARNTTHPRVVNATLIHGSITVKVHNGKDVIVEAPASATRRTTTERPPDGMHRIDMPVRGLVVEEDDNVIHIRSSSPETSSLVITVPADTSLHLRSTHGGITAQGIHGEIEATSIHGGIELTNISGTVVADTTNGAIKVSMDRVEAGKPIAFSTTNGSVDVTLPADFKANLKIRAARGEVWSDFDMKLTGAQPTTSGRDGRGPYRVEFDRTIYGTINGGGTDASFRSINGRITIRKK